METQVFQKIPWKKWVFGVGCDFNHGFKVDCATDFSFPGILVSRKPQNKPWRNGDRCLKRTMAEKKRFFQKTIRTSGESAGF